MGGDAVLIAVRPTPARAADPAARRTTGPAKPTARSAGTADSCHPRRAGLD